MKYPIFHQVSKISQDNFWIQVFKDLSNGKTPFGVYFDDDALCCRFKGQQFHFKFQGKEPYEILESVKHILNTKMNMLSDKDYMQDRKQFSHLLEAPRPSEWRNIKRKYIKDSLLEMYVLRLQKQEELTLGETKELLNMFNMGFYFKLITADDVTCVDGEIQHIEVPDLSKLEVRKSSSDEGKEGEGGCKVCLHEMWLKYINVIC
jgi:hypothetical protein